MGKLWGFGPFCVHTGPMERHIALSNTPHIRFLVHSVMPHLDQGNNRDNDSMQLYYCDILIMVMLLLKNIYKDNSAEV